MTHGYFADENVHLGLKDEPTLTELCALALYSQAISRPYLAEVRGCGTNHLDLGPLHERVRAHCRAIINSPELILTPGASHVTGALGGGPWQRPEVMQAIWELVPSLPHLPGVLKMFFEGALETWERFCREFAPGGKIAGLTEAQRKRAWMPPTNDDNEGALGGYRVDSRQAPNMSVGHHNARRMYKINNTRAYLQDLDPENRKFLRQVARQETNDGEAERKRKREIVEEDERTAAKKRAAIRERDGKKAARRTKLAGIDPILQADRLSAKSLTAAQIEEQLDWHREFYDTAPKGQKQIPMKSHLRNKAAKLAALIAAVERFNASPLDPLPTVETALMGSQPTPVDEEECGVDWGSDEDC